MKVFCSFTITICVAAILVTHLVESTPEEAFDLFMYKELHTNFSLWLRSNHLDPSPVIPQPVSLNFTYVDNDNLTSFTTTGEIRNQQVSGHSNQGMPAVGSNLTESWFGVNYLLYYQFIGEYQVEAETSQGNVSASGESDLRLITTALPFFYIMLRNFTVTPEGHIDLSTAEVTPNYFNNYEGIFEGLSENDPAQKIVINGISKMIYPALVYEFCPLPDYLVQFMQEVFDKTPLADIIKPSP